MGLLYFILAQNASLKKKNRPTISAGQHLFGLFYNIFLNLGNQLVLFVSVDHHLNG